MLYGNLDEASLSDHAAGAGAGAGKNHELADPQRYPYSAVGALFAYAETPRGAKRGSAGSPAPSPPGVASIGATYALQCSGALISPRHVLTAATCVSRPHYSLTWTPSTTASLAASWSDWEFVPALYGDCSRGGGSRVVGARVPKEWAAWDDASVAASLSGGGDAAPSAASARNGSAVDWNFALLTLDSDAPGAPGFFALPPHTAGAVARGTNLTRVAYGAAGVGTSHPVFSSCPVLDVAPAVATGAPPALVLACAMYGANKGAPLWPGPPPPGTSARTIAGVQATTLDYWHAFARVDADAAASTLVEAVAAVAAADPEDAAIATAVTGAVADRLRAWMEEDGVKGHVLAKAGPASRGAPVANPRPPLLGGVKGGDDAPSPPPPSKPKQRKGRDPSVGALDAAERSRRAAHVPGAPLAEGAAPPPSTFPSTSSCPLPAGTLPRPAPRDAEAVLTAGPGLGDPPRYGRHVPLPLAQTALFPFSAVGSLRAYKNASAAAAAAAAGAPADGGAPRAPPVERTCSASLVGPRHALTAHHCVFNATGRKSRDPASMVFFPAAAAGCGKSGGAVRAARVVSLRALPAAQGCLDDLSSDGTVRTEKAASTSACDDVLSTDYALLELDAPLGDVAGFFALGPPPGKGFPPTGTNLTLAGYGAPDSIGVRGLSLSTCVLLPVDALATARKIAARRAGAAPPPAPPSGGAVLFTGCRVEGGDSGAPLWQPPSSGNGERRLLGVTSTVQAVWSVAARVDPAASSGWPRAWAATYGASDAVQSSAVALDDVTSNRLRGWMVDDGTDASAFSRAGRAPTGAAAATAAAEIARAPAAAPSAADGAPPVGAPEPQVALASAVGN